MSGLHGFGERHGFAAAGTALMVVRRGNRIREIRARVGVSTTELGSAIGMTQSHVSRLENAKVALTLDILYRIAEALDVDPRELLDAGDGRSETHFAPVKGDLRSKTVLSPPYQLVPLAVNLSVDAFQYDEQSFLFAEPAFPGKLDRELLWILRHTINGPERVDECERVPGTGYTKVHSQAIGSVKVDDPRILDMWRVTAEFTVLHGGWPRMILRRY